MADTIRPRPFSRGPRYRERTINFFSVPSGFLSIGDPLDDPASGIVLSVTPSRDWFASQVREDGVSYLQIVLVTAFDFGDTIDWRPTDLYATATTGRLGIVDRGHWDPTDPALARACSEALSGAPEGEVVPWGVVRPVSSSFEEGRLLLASGPGGEIAGVRVLVDSLRDQTPP